MILLRTFVTLLLLAAPLATAHADRKEDARAASDRGDRAFKKNDLAGALIEYQASWEKYPKPFLLFRIAECQRGLGKDQEALDTYKKYVDKVKKGGDRRKAEAYVAELEQKIAAAAPPAEPVAPPPKPVEQSSDREAPPMRDAEVASAKNKSGGPRITTASDPKPDTLPPGWDPNAPPPVPVASTAPEKPPAPPKPVYKRWWLWTAVVGGLAVVGVGVGVGLAFGLPKFQSELPVGGPGAALTVGF